MARIAGVLLSVTLSMSCAGSVPGNDDLTNGQEDPNRNVVVRLWGGNCSGTFITPLVVLTAQHCVQSHGDNPTVDVGARSFGGLVKINVSGAHAPRVERFRPEVSVPFEFGRDAALLIFDWSALSEVSRSAFLLDVVHIRRPGLDSPERPSGLGIAGYSTINADGRAGFRQVKMYGPWIDLRSNTDGTQATWDSSNRDVHPGDSGGPLFIAHGDGTREVIGIVSGWTIGDRFTDITRAPIRSFILSRVLDSQNGDHSSRWLAQHGKNAEDFWLGEVDYTGPCDDVTDPDCDHWSGGHDNCPEDFNPDQKDSLDNGIGDECRVRAAK